MYREQLDSPFYLYLIPCKMFIRYAYRMYCTGRQPYIYAGGSCSVYADVAILLRMLTSQNYSAQKG